jgi:membrane fusion protein (multidrug efflux system)
MTPFRNIARRRALLRYGLAMTDEAQPIQSEPRPRVWRRILFGLVFLAMVAVAGHYGWQWWTVEQYHESTDNAYVRGEITPISAKIPGYVSSVNVSDNQRIGKGEVLLVIQPAEFEARIAQAHAELATSRTELEILASRRALQPSVIAQAEAEHSIAEAEEARAAQALERSQSLIERGITTRDRHEEAVADASKAEAAMRKAAAALATARKETLVMDAQKLQLEATIKEREAAYVLAEMQLDDTEIRAPIAGVVGNRSVHTGQYVRPGAQLMVLVPLDDVWVVANFKETQLTDMAPGQPVDIEVDTFPGRILKGRVESFSPASGAEFSLLPPENASGNFNKIVQRIPVKIVLEKNNALAGRLRPGMSVVATVITGSPQTRGAHAGNRE